MPVERRVTDGAKTIYFREEQRFSQRWMWALVCLPGVFVFTLFGWGFIQQFVLGIPWGTRPMSDTALVLVGCGSMLFAVLMSFLFFSTRLITEVSDEGIFIRFIPFVKKTIPFVSIRSCHARTYRPIREYGGWGIKYGRGGKAYTISGDRGVQFEFYNGKPLLIGSRMADELAGTIRERIGPAGDRGSTASQESVRWSTRLVKWAGWSWHILKTAMR